MELAHEARLVERVRNDGSDGRLAYDDLVREHQQWLVRYLVYVLGDQGRAEDVAQEVLVKAYTSIHLYRGDARLKSWLRSIATRLAFNQRRDASTRQRYEDQADARTESAGPEGAVLARDVLIGVLERLAYPYREVLVLRYVEELSVAEIATTLGLSGSAAKMRVKRARDAFWELHAALEEA
jgi:RNA polymerase sigma-70 factor (ECF subfamily)